MKKKELKRWLHNLFARGVPRGYVQQKRPTEQTKDEKQFLKFMKRDLEQK